METILKSPGFNHIVKKILHKIERFTFEEEDLKTIFNLRLVSKTLKEAVETYYWRLSWLNLPLERKSETKDSWCLYLLSKNEFDRKLSWKLLHFTFSLNVSKMRESYDTKCYDKYSQYFDEYFESDFRHIIPRPEPFEMLLCNGPFEIVSAVFQNSKLVKDISDAQLYRLRKIIEDEVIFKRLFLLSIFVFKRQDIAKIICEKNHNFWQSSWSKQCIKNVTQVILKCDTHHYKDILNFLIDITNEPESMVTFYDEKYEKNIIEFLTKFSNCQTNCAKNLPQPQFDEFWSQGDITPNRKLQNPLFMILHNKFYYRHEEMITIFTKLLKKVTYPQQISRSVLILLNKYAALTGCLEIAKIIEEKLGPVYVALAIQIMQKCSHWAKENVLKFMALKIDKHDKMKVENFEDTSLHVSAKKMEWQFIINFAPFSSTIAEKCLNRKNALGLVLDINTSDLEPTEKILHQKASESLETFNAKSAPEGQDFACQFDGKN